MISKTSRTNALLVSGALFFGGCSPEAEPNEISPEIAEIVELGSPSHIEHIYTVDASEELGELIASVGSIAIEEAIGRSFEAKIDDRNYELTLSYPRNEEAREQVVIFTGDSRAAPQIFEQYLGREVEDWARHLTLYTLEPDEYGYSLSSPSVSVVGQEFESVGPFHAITTEYCQGLDMAFEEPQVITVDDYRLAKESVCNTLGVAADSSFLNHSYEQYVDRVDGNNISANITQGRDVPYIPVAEGIYNNLYSPPAD